MGINNTNVNGTNNLQKRFLNQCVRKVDFYAPLFSALSKNSELIKFLNMKSY